MTSQIQPSGILRQESSGKNIIALIDSGHGKLYNFNGRKLANVMV